jgi:hypothetical protein
MNPRFITIAGEGRSGWKQYLSGTLLTYGVAFAILFPTIMLCAHLSGFSGEQINIVVSGNPFRHLFFRGVGGAGMLLGLFLAVTRVHRRQFITLFGIEASVDWVRVLKSFALWLALSGVGFALCYLLFPSRYLFAFYYRQWIPFALLAMICLPIISMARVLFFYGYLLQAGGLLIRRPIVLAIVYGLMFSTLDNLANFKVSSLIIDMLLGTFISWIVLKDNRVELTLGIDMAASLASGLVFRRTGSLANWPSLFRVNESYVIPFAITLTLTVFSAGVFYYAFFVDKRGLPRLNSDSSRFKL